MLNNFPTTHQLNKLQFEDPKPRKSEFWSRLVFYLVIGAFAGGVACAVYSDGSVFLPVTGVVALLSWAVGSSMEDKE